MSLKRRGSDYLTLFVFKTSNFRWNFVLPLICEAYRSVSTNHGSSLTKCPEILRKLKIGKNLTKIDVCIKYTKFEVTPIRLDFITANKSLMNTFLYIYIYLKVPVNFSEPEEPELNFYHSIRHLKMQLCNIKTFYLLRFLTSLYTHTKSNNTCIWYCYLL